MKNKEINWPQALVEAVSVIAMSVAFLGITSCFARGIEAKHSKCQIEGSK